MVTIQLTMESQALRATTDVNVLYPLKRSFGFGDPEGKTAAYQPLSDRLPVLWLVHGGGDNFSDWVNRTRLAELADKVDLMVVMPSIRDFTSSRRDVDYYTFLTEELPAYIRRIFPASDKREDNFIGGLSMGGYFSYRIALNYPERYSHVGSLSSPLDIVEDLRIRHKGSKTLVEADALIGTDRDLRALVEKNLAAGAELPRMFQACGTEDFTYEINVAMREFFREKKLDLTYLEGPGIHNWQFWDTYIEKLIEWLPLKKAGEPGKPAGHKFQKGGE